MAIMAMPAAMTMIARYQNARVVSMFSATLEPIRDDCAGANVFLFCLSVGLVMFVDLNHLHPIDDEASAVFGDEMEIVCLL